MPYVDLKMFTSSECSILPSAIGVTAVNSCFLDQGSKGSAQCFSLLLFFCILDFGKPCFFAVLTHAFIFMLFFCFHWRVEGLCPCEPPSLPPSVIASTPRPAPRLPATSTPRWSPSQRRTGQGCRRARGGFRLLGPVTLTASGRGDLLTFEKWGQN